MVDSCVIVPESLEANLGVALGQEQGREQGQAEAVVEGKKSISGKPRFITAEGRRPLSPQKRRSAFQSSNGKRKIKAKEENSGASLDSLVGRPELRRLLVSLTLALRGIR